jgi:hypothetical protein
MQSSIEKSSGVTDEEWDALIFSTLPLSGPEEMNAQPVWLPQRFALILTMQTMHS